MTKIVGFIPARMESSRFPGVSIEGTINAAYMEYYADQAQSDESCLARISGDDQDAPGQMANEADANGRTLTTNYTDWTIPPESVHTWYQSPSIVSVIQELVDSYTISNDAIQIIMRDNGSDDPGLRIHDGYSDTGQGDKIHIEYTAAAGGNAPTGHIEGPLYGPLGGPI